MAENEQQESQQSTKTSGSAGSGAAVKAAAAAAATGVAALAAKKALSGRGNGEAKNGGSSGSGSSDSVFSSMVSGGWEAARDSLLPMAEDAAGAAGKYLANSAPDVVRERIVPRFISSFNDASGGGS
jgi:hypothetical protein